MAKYDNCDMQMPQHHVSGARLIYPFCIDHALMYETHDPKAPKALILIVDDDEALRTLTADYLEQAGFATLTANGGAQLNVSLTKNQRPPDLIIMDIMMPGEDGLSLCRKLRDQDGPPVILLSAKGDEIDRILGLELGADDFIAKPFHPRELVARIRAVLRRQGSNGLNLRSKEGRGHGIRFHGLELDLIKRTLLRSDGVTIALSNAEFDLLLLFLDRPGVILTRDEILDQIQGRHSESFDRAIDVQISRLRRKLTFGKSATPIIKTVRGMGYMYVSPT